MMRDPIVLTDTAMVLLRRYDEALQNYKALRDAYEEAQRDTKRILYDTFDIAQRIRAYRLIARDILYELEEELWYLWHDHDTPRIRHLDSHLIFDSESMNDMAQIFLSPSTSIMDQIPQRTNRHEHVRLLGPLLTNILGLK